jgi:hypothetical protein
MSGGCCNIFLRITAGTATCGAWTDRIVAATGFAVLYRWRLQLIGGEASMVCADAPCILTTKKQCLLTMKPSCTALVCCGRATSAGVQGPVTLAGVVRAMLQLCVRPHLFVQAFPEAAL